MNETSMQYSSFNFSSKYLLKLIIIIVNKIKAIHVFFSNCFNKQTGCNKIKMRKNEKKIEYIYKNRFNVTWNGIVKIILLSVFICVFKL